jgi:hypothetical protein
VNNSKSVGMRNLFKLKSSKGEDKAKAKPVIDKAAEESNDEPQFMAPPPEGVYGDNDEDLGYC